MHNALQPGGRADLCDALDRGDRSALGKSRSAPIRYQRHRPDKADLHRIIRENLDVVTPDDPDATRPPAFVRKAFEEYVK